MDKFSNIAVRTRAKSVGLQSVAFEKKLGEDKKGEVKNNE